MSHWLKALTDTKTMKLRKERKEVESAGKDWNTGNHLAGKGHSVQ